MIHRLAYILIFLLLGCQHTDDVLFAPTLVDGDEIFVPRNLEEAHMELDRGLSEYAKMILKEDHENLNEKERSIRFFSLGHMGFGMWVRNNWQLWGGGELAQTFNKLGVFHPDDMSALIFDSYIARLRGEEYRMDEVVEYYQTYWKRVAKPEPVVDGDSGHTIGIVDNEVAYHLEDGTVVHVGEDKTTEEVWLYTFERGWFKPNEKDLEEIDRMIQGSSQLLNAP